MSARSALIALAFAVVASPAFSHSGPISDRWEARGDRIDHRLDVRGDRIDAHLDHRADRAASNGRFGKAARLDSRGDRIDYRLDVRGDRLEHRSDRIGARRQGRRG
jgi:hypothetical protein